LRQTIRAPDGLGESLIELLARVEISFLELFVRAEWKATLSAERQKAGIVVISLLVEAPREQILAEVVLTLAIVWTLGRLARPSIWQVAVARVEALRQEKQIADAIAVLLKLARMRKL
jgi:hypothetical protein